LGTAAIWQPLAIWQLRRFGDLGDLLKRFSIGDLGTPAIWRFGDLAASASSSWRLQRYSSLGKIGAIWQPRQNRGSRDLGAAVIWQQRRSWGSGDLGAAAIWQQRRSGGSSDLESTAKW